MKVYISYFYQIRFFKPYQIPVSTADWDPKWFHQNKGQSHIWKDANGVWNGIRLEILNPSHCCSILPPECVLCSGTERHPESCSFLKDYREGLDKIGFEELMCYLNGIGDHFKQLEKFDEEPEIILIVHEAPNNPCSERIPLQDYFLSNNRELKEWCIIDEGE